MQQDVKQRRHNNISQQEEGLSFRAKNSSSSNDQQAKVRRAVASGSGLSLVTRNLFALFLLSLVGLCVLGYYSLVPIAERKQAVTMMAAAHSAAHITAGKKPFLLYGTAWKKERTAEYVLGAVRAGFRFVDTACQPKHYNEPGVGEGWSLAALELGLKRSDLFLQTKYTPVDGQDPNDVPYDSTAPLDEQVRQSVAASLANLKTSYLDSLVLHSPLDTTEDTMVVWRAMESFVDSGKVLRLGISNCYDHQQFVSLYDMAKIKPSVLQNRFRAETNFDTDLRAFCKAKGIWYQSFWTLTANRHALATDEAKGMAKAKGLPSAQTLMFAFLMSLGYVTPLSGTTDPKHMAEDVAVMERMEGGETFFESEAELRQFAELLGMPDL